MSEHPSPQQLDSFALGALSDPDARAVEEHLTACVACQAETARVGTDALVSLLRSARSRSAATGDTPSVTLHQTSVSCETVVAALQQLPAPLAQHERYRLLRPLGAGGMGAVWLAEHTVMGRRVALKVIRPEFLARAGAAERFLREVQLAAKLHHPNIVTAHDAERAGQSHFLVMEYVEGTTLAQRVKEGALPMREACRVVLDAALGLEHAHRHGMVHRDIKPHNLIQNEEGVVKILDFGLAFMNEDAPTALSGASIVMGTPDYIAPEQAENPRGADGRSDIYSLGCTLYQLLTGQVPYPGDSALKKLDRHRHEDTPDLRRLRPDAPPALAAIVAKMMAKDPRQRYQTPADVAAALRPFAESRQQDAGSRGYEKRQSPRRRQPLLVAALALLCASLVTAVGVVYYIVTDNGAIEISTEDENIKIIGERNGQHITIFDPQSKQTWVVGTGDWTVRLDGAPDGLVIEMPTTFTLRRGGKQVVSVKRVKGPDVVVKPPDKPAVAPRPNGELLFKEDFDAQETSANPLFDRKLMTFEHVRGEGVLTPRAHGVLPAMYEKIKVADFYAEFDLRVPAAALSSGYGLIFRSADVSEGAIHEYYALFLYPTEGAIVLDCWQKVKWAEGSKFLLKPGSLSVTKANRIRLEAVAGEFRVFVNGVFACEFNNGLLVGPGIFALAVGDAAERAEAVYFDNFRVYAP